MVRSGLLCVCGGEGGVPTFPQGPGSGGGQGFAEQDGVSFRTVSPDLPPPARGERCGLPGSLLCASPHFRVGKNP